MSLKVVGAGFGRTGTLSLKFALEKIGFAKCYHMMEVHQQPAHRKLWQDAHQGKPIDWDALFEGYQASVDWPSCNLWREQLIQYPDAKVILSLRDPEKWYASVMATIYKGSNAGRNSEDESAREASRWVFEIIWQRVFEDRMEDKDYVIDIFNAHNQRVIEEVPKDQLLVFEAAEGWEPLCQFLDVPIPDEPYPRVNSTEEFAERWRKKDD